MRVNSLGGCYTSRDDANNLDRLPPRPGANQTSRRTCNHPNRRLGVKHALVLFHQAVHVAVVAKLKLHMCRVGVPSLPAPLVRACVGVGVRALATDSNTRRVQRVVLVGAD